MKAWTLTAFYLSKDIWSRWCETPGALAARLLVAGLLAGLLLLTGALLRLGERNLEARLAGMGGRTLLLNEAVSAGTDQAPPLGRTLAALAANAELVALRQLPVTARDGAGRDCLVLVYGEESLPALAPWLAVQPGADGHLFTAQLPAGLPVRLEVDGTDVAASTLPAPEWLLRFTGGRAALLLPAARAGDWLELGHFETVQLTLRETGGPEIRRLAAALRSLLFLDGRSTAQLQSPERLLDELDALQLLQARLRHGSGLAAGLLAALVFGSIAVLEYRQNRFTLALLRSLGAPAPLLLLRYAAEAALIAVAAVLLARGLAAGLHAPLFGQAGFPAALLDRTTLDPYAWAEVWRSGRWLLLGGVLGVLPVAFALRQPVGRVLQ
ncbi:MAG: hypothetical protein KIT44_04690 [Opitutaceae bacterium]|nr:hypothetical protein [Opitutaceae bacterium]